MFGRDEEENYTYSCPRMILANEDGMQFMASEFGLQERDADLSQIELEAGTYIFYVEMEWSEKSLDLRDFAVSTYGPSEVRISEADYSIDDFLQKVFASHFEKKRMFWEDKQTLKSQGIEVDRLTFDGADKFGYQLTMIKNDTEQTFTEEVQYSECVGISLVAPLSGTSYDVEVGPGDQQLVILRCSRMSYGFQMGMSFGLK